MPVPSFEKANLMSLSKASIENNRNVNTNFFAATIENENETVEVSGEKIWKKHDFFNAIKSDFNMEKVNYPENTLFYINQAIKVKNNKKIFYCDYFILILRQIVESSNPPENISTHTLKENEVRMIRPKYDTSTGEFEGLYKTIGFLVVKGAPD